MAHHFKMVVLLFLQGFRVFKYQGHVNSFRVRHEEKSVVTGHACHHAKPTEIDRLEVNGVFLRA